MSGALILLSPISPASAGNGLAMRSELFRRAASTGFDVTTVVVPVAGTLPNELPASSDLVVGADREAARAGVVELAIRPAWRERLARAGPLPMPARAASPGLAEVVARAVGDVRPVGVHVMRSYLAPLGVAAAERLGAAWITLDLDEDDAALAAALGRPDDAAAFGRLVDVFVPLVDGVSMASPEEAASAQARHRLPVHVVPNAVDVRVERPHSSDRAQSILFVGNLTYAPNVDAVERLVEAVLPVLRRRLGAGVRVVLVGTCDSRVRRLARSGVEVTGFLADLAPSYASADVVVVPLRVGGGTRIKLLEAFAYGVPVVASRPVAAGLQVTDEDHLLLADEPEELATAVERILTDTPLAERLVGEARRLVQRTYSTEAVLPVAQALFRDAAGGARVGVRSNE